MNARFVILILIAIMNRTCYGCTSEIDEKQTSQIVVTKLNHTQDRIAVERTDHKVRERLSFFDNFGRQNRVELTDEVADCQSDVKGGFVLASTDHIERSPITSVDFSPAGDLVVVGRKSGVCDVWSFATKALVASVTLHNAPVTSVKFANGSILYSTGSDGRIMRLSLGRPHLMSSLFVFDLSSGLDINTSQQIAFGIHGESSLVLTSLDYCSDVLCLNIDSVSDVCFVEGGTELICINRNGAMLQSINPSQKRQTWAVGSGRLDNDEAADDVSYLRIDGPIYLNVSEVANGVAVSVQGTLKGDRIELRSVSTGDLKSEIQTGQSQVVFASSVQGNLIAIAGMRRGLEVWTSSLDEPHRVAVISKDVRCVATVAFSTDSKTIATGLNDGRLVIWPTSLDQESLSPPRADASPNE